MYCYIYHVTVISINHILLEDGSSVMPTTATVPPIGSSTVITSTAGTVSVTATMGTQIVNSQTNDESSSSSVAGVVAGCVVSVVVIVIIVVVLVLMVWYLRRRRKNEGIQGS